MKFGRVADNELVQITFFLIILINMKILKGKIFWKSKRIVWRL